MIFKTAGHNPDWQHDKGGGGLRQSEGGSGGRGRRMNVAKSEKEVGWVLKHRVNSLKAVNYICVLTNLSSKSIKLCVAASSFKLSTVSLLKSVKMSMWVLSRQMWGPTYKEIFLSSSF